MSARAFRRQRHRRIAAARRRAQLRLRRAGFVAGAAAGGFAIALPASAAADFQVNSSADAPVDTCDPLPAGCTLRDAVNAANTTAGPDTITFNSALSGNPITLTQGEIQIASGDGSATTISGGGTITVSGDANGNSTPDTGDSRIFNVSGSGPTTISGLALTVGYRNGQPGGAIVDYGPDLTITGSTVTNSKSTNGGGAIADASTGPGSISITNSTISGNTTTGSGGAILAPPKYQVVTISDSTLSGNHSDSSGGAIAGGKYSPLNVTDSTIRNNSASFDGGGISAGGKYAPMQISGSTISGNSAALGGGIYFSNTTCTPYPPPGPSCDAAGPSDSEIVDSTISGNHGTGSGPQQGGGLALGELIDGDTFSISRSTISGNQLTSTTSYGGGIAVGRQASPDTVDGEMRLVDSTVSGNHAGAGGGVGIKAQVGENGSISADNSTIASNTATYEGGGLWAYAYGPSGGPYASPPVALKSTIAGDNSPDDLGRGDLATSGAFQLSFSLVEAPTDAIDTQASSITGQDPQLGGLASNGGPTRTQLPATTSPAIDAGSNPLGLATDQRGDPRTIDLSPANAQDGTDIGAVELAAPTPSPSPPVTPPAKKKPKCKKKHKKKHKRTAESSKKKHKHKKCKKKHKKKRR